VKGGLCTPNSTYAAAQALEGGCTIECDRVYQGNLEHAFAQNLSSLATLAKQVGYTLKTLIQAGVMDPVGRQPYTRIGLDVVGSAQHMELSRAAAAQGMVLLRNDDGVLPLKPSRW
jgi:beta-glucosidase-like glycosyl hydrolase